MFATTYSILHMLATTNYSSTTHESGVPNTANIGFCATNSDEQRCRPLFPRGCVQLNRFNR
ncbi:hypothetical protein DL95DRAFT_392927 [Leptodontidium sp. 2 PMI_412]|nr:hypothetical protein DL95DRAFT_392927 [Leptodontidium sp. 2 PMI_412]